MSSHFTLGLRTLRVAGLTVALFAAMCTPLLAQAPPSADTFVSSAFSKTNFGSVGTMNVGGGSTSYMQFNLSGIPSGATVTKATLRLYVDLVISNGTFDVYQVNKSWSESALTYNNQPLPLGSSATGGHPISITSSSFNQFLLIDITALAQSWVSGSTPNYGVALALPSGSAANFYLDSKESLLTANGRSWKLRWQERLGRKDRKAHRDCREHRARLEQSGQRDRREQPAHQAQPERQVLRETPVQPDRKDHPDHPARREQQARKDRKA